MIQRLLQSLFTSPTLSLGFITLISFACLAAAFIAEAVFLLEPCELCIYQRYPFALVIILGLVGLALRTRPIAVIGVHSISAVSFFVNSGIAFYHTGVEQHWWSSAIEGCKNPFVEIENTDTSQSFLDNIMSAPLGDCSVIPWQDPIIGLSMANYNIGVCFALGIFCIISAFKSRMRQSPVEVSSQ